jgi:hypothetical protein
MVEYMTHKKTAPYRPAFMIVRSPEKDQDRPSVTSPGQNV